MTRIRPATIADLTDLMRLERSTFVSDAWSEGQLRAELLDRNTVYVALVEEDDASGADELVGYGGVLAPRGSGDADIQTIAVAERMRGRGLGRALMTALLDAAVARAATRVFLEVRADNPVAQALYTSLGFTGIGVRPRYYQPDGVDAIVMRLDLPAPTEAGSGGTASGTDASGAGA